MTEETFNLSLTAAPAAAPAAPATVPAPNPTTAKTSAKAAPPAPLPGVPLTLAAGNAAVIAAGAAIAAPATAGLSLAGGALVVAGVAAARRRTTRRARRGGRATVKRAQAARTGSVASARPSRSAAAGRKVAGGKAPASAGAVGGAGRKASASTGATKRPAASSGTTGGASKKPVSLAKPVSLKKQPKAVPAQRPASGKTASGGLGKTSTGRGKTATGGRGKTASAGGGRSGRMGLGGGSGRKSTGTGSGGRSGSRLGGRSAGRSGGRAGKSGMLSALGRSRKNTTPASKTASSPKTTTSPKRLPNVAKTNGTPGGHGTGRPLSRNKAIRAGQRAWRKTANARRATQAGARRARQATTAGLLAGVGGGLAGLLTWNGRRGKRVAARIWHAWRARQARANTTRANKIQQRINPDTLSAPTVNDPQRKPATTRKTADIHRPGDGAAAFGLKRTSPGTTLTPAGTTTTAGTAPTGAATMSTFSFHDAAAELTSAAGSYAVEPDEAGAMMQVKHDLELFPEAMNHIAEAIRVWYAKLAEGGYDMDPSVTEAMHDVYTAQLAVAQAATNVPTVFSTAHGEQIERHENRRAGDKGWNLT